MTRRELVLTNLDLPRRLWFRRLQFQPCAVVLVMEEVISAGNLGLVQAAVSWHPNDNGQFRPYAARAVIHAVYLEADRTRRRSRNEFVSVDELPLAARLDRVDPFEWQDVLLVMARLPEYDRALLADRCLGLMTFQEMADQRGISKANVQKWYAVALQRAQSISQCC